jgi:MraZ protein
MLGDKDLGAYERRIFSQSARIPMDSAGRVRIPERLLKDHGLSGKAMVLGVGDHLEVFSPEQWSQDREKLEPVRSDIWNRARQNVALNQRNGNES